MPVAFQKTQMRVIDSIWSSGLWIDGHVPLALYHASCWPSKTTFCCQAPPPHMPNLSLSAEPLRSLLHVECKTDVIACDMSVGALLPSPLQPEYSPDVGRFSSSVRDKRGPESERRPFNQRVKTSALAWPLSLIPTAAAKNPSLPPTGEDGRRNPLLTRFASKGRSSRNWFVAWHGTYWWAPGLRSLQTCPPGTQNVNLTVTEKKSGKWAMQGRRNAVLLTAAARSSRRRRYPSSEAHCS